MSENAKSSVETVKSHLVELHSGIRDVSFTVANYGRVSRWLKEAVDSQSTSRSQRQGSQESASRFQGYTKPCTDAEESKDDKAS